MAARRLVPALLALLVASAYAADSRTARNLLTIPKLEVVNSGNIGESFALPWLGYNLDVRASNNLFIKKDKINDKPVKVVEPIARSTAIGIVPGGPYAYGGILSSAGVNGKFAPAKAVATAYGQTVASGPRINVHAMARATARPGLAWGTTISAADGTAITPLVLNQQLLSVPGQAAVLSSSRATAGTGQAISGAKAKAVSGNTAISLAETSADAARWYMSPGNSVSGGLSTAIGGLALAGNSVRSRVDLGTATSGALTVVKSNGQVPTFSYGFPFPLWIFGANGWGGNAGGYTPVTGVINAYERANADAGVATAGAVNVGLIGNGGTLGYGGRLVILNDLQASAAVGEALGGAVNVGVTNAGGGVLIGDYDNSDATQNDVVARVRGRGEAQGGLLNIGLAPNDNSEITGSVVVAADQGNAIAGGMALSNARGTARNDMAVTSSTSEYVSAAGLLGLSQSQEQAQNTLAASAKSNIGPAFSAAGAQSALGEQAIATSSSSATTVTGQAASAAGSQSLGGVTTESQAASTATTKDGNAVSAGGAMSISAFTAESVSTSSSTTTNGAAMSASGALSFAADAEADSASSAAAAVGNVGSASGALAPAVIQGKANSASSAASETGSVGSASFAGSTGAIQAQTKVSSSAQTADGNAQAVAGSISVSGINAVSSSKSTAASQTGDVDATAESFGLGGFHGEANADAAAATGCPECDSVSTATAVATGAIADATARAKADSPKNPGQAIANAMALGAVSRTSNGGQARVAIGPAQALTGGFAVSAPRAVVAEVNRAAASAVDPSKKAGKTVVGQMVGSMLPKPVAKSA